MDENANHLWAAFFLFDRLDLDCFSCGVNRYNYIDVDAAFALLDEDKIRCHIMDCVAALHLMQMRKQRVAIAETAKIEFVKRKVFNAAISMILNDEFDNDRAVVNTILSALPDERRMTDKRIWLPVHFAIALTTRNKISKDDILTLLSSDPKAMGRLSNKKAVGYEGEDSEDEEVERVLVGCTPAHLFCMQKQPKISLVRYFCLHDEKAFAQDDQSGRSALHLVTQNSESMKLLECILKIDGTLTKKKQRVVSTQRGFTPLGLLCRRLHFPTFDEMLACLIKVDSSIAVIYDGIIANIMSYEECLQQDISPGSRGERSVTLIKKLLDTQPTVVFDSNILCAGCIYLRGELGISVLSTILSRGGFGVKDIFRGSLLIHSAANFSCFYVLKFLHKLYPESMSILDVDERTLLHLAFTDMKSGDAVIYAKVRYVCDQCPALIHLKDKDGETALHSAIINDTRFNVKCMKTLCDIDATVVRSKITPNDITQRNSGKLPLHILIECRSPMTEGSDEGDFFRLLLRLYPAAAGIKDDHSRSPYDIAVANNLSTYFLRCLLSADPTIDPVERHNLNCAARRQGMFLAFNAASTDMMPTIWAKIRNRGRDLLQHVISYF
jgi:ankyrin repeat protein